MKIDEYEKEAEKTWVGGDTQEEGNIFAVLGCNEEIGEVIQEIRKGTQNNNFHKKKIDIEHVQEEIGDVIYYIMIISRSSGINMREVLNANLKKISLRYNVNIDSFDVKTFSKYKEEAMKTIKSNILNCDRERLLIGSLGLTKEIGRVSEEIGENIIEGNGLRKDKITEKLGDAYWYVNFIADTLGLDIDKCIDTNIKKIGSRYNKDESATQIDR